MYRFHTSLTNTALSQTFHDKLDERVRLLHISSIITCLLEY